MFKKLIIISLILLTIISIGAVSAAENVSETNLKSAEINEKTTVENDVKKDIIDDDVNEVELQPDYGHVALHHEPAEHHGKER